MEAAKVDFEREIRALKAVLLKKDEEIGSLKVVALAAHC